MAVFERPMPKLLENVAAPTWVVIVIVLSDAIATLAGVNTVAPWSM